jgi:hypothetical protein
VALGAPRPLFCGNTDFCGAGICLGDGGTVEVGASAPLTAGVGNDAVSDGEGDGDFSSSGLGDGGTVEVGASAPLTAGVGNDAVSDGEGDGDFSSSRLGDGDAVFFFTLTGEAEGDRFFLDFFFR